MNNKIAICYTCCGPTYRSTAREKLLNLYPDNKDIYYFVITDDTTSFVDIERANLYVYNLKDFYDEFPHLEIYEPFLESKNKEDYAEKFIDQGYRFPFSTNRLHLILASRHDITNVALLGTDTDLHVEKFPQYKCRDNIIYNTVSRWDSDISESNMGLVVSILNDKYGLCVDKQVRVFDAAGKLFCFESTDYMLNFFNIWDDIMQILYKEDNIKHFAGGYAVNNEYILAPIYNAIGIRGLKSDIGLGLFDARHNPAVERFWCNYS